LKSRQLAAGVAFGAALGTALYGTVFALPVYLQALLGSPPTRTGLVILPGALASASPWRSRAATPADQSATLVLTGVALFMISMCSGGTSPR